MTCAQQPAGPLVFFTAFLVVVFGTTVIDPSRVLLLLIPSSFLLASYGIGLILTRVAGPLATVPCSPMLDVSLKLGTGMAILGLVSTILGLLSYYRVSGFFFFGGIACSLFHFFPRIGAIRRAHLSPTAAVSGIVMGSVWLVVWLWATIPSVFYDELAYHLPIAQFALRTGQLPALPWSFLTLMPHLSDLLLGWGVALGNDVGARAMHLAFWVGIWIASWSLLEFATRSAHHAWLGLALTGALASCVTFLFLGALTFAETSLTFGVVAAAALIAQRPTPSPWLPLGLLWGFILSVKLSGPSWILAELVAAASMGWSLRSLLAAGTVAVAIVLPWWGRAWASTGNPFFPLGHTWWGGNNWDDAAQARLRQDLPHLEHLFDPSAWIHIPYDMIAFPERFGSASAAGALAVGSVCLAMVLPLLTFSVKTEPSDRRWSMALSGFMLIAILAWVATSITTRFLAPALVLGLLLLVTLITRLPPVARWAAILGLVLAGTWGTVHFTSQHAQAFLSNEVAWGRESDHVYLSRVLDHADSAAYVRETLSKEAHLLFIGESRPFHFDRPSLAPYPYNTHPLTRWVEEAGSPEALLSTIRQAGITHIVLNTREFKRLHDSYQVLAFQGPEAALLDERLRQVVRSMPTLFAKNHVYILEVPRGPAFSVR